MKRWEWYNKLLDEDKSLTAQALEIYNGKLKDHGADTSGVDLHGLYNAIVEHLEEEIDEK